MTLRDLTERTGLTAQSVVVRTYDVAVGVDGKAPDQVEVQLFDPKSVVCSASGEAAFGDPNGRPMRARADADAVIHILALALPE